MPMRDAVLRAFHRHRHRVFDLWPHAALFILPFIASAGCGLEAYPEAPTAPHVLHTRLRTHNGPPFARVSIHTTLRRLPPPLHQPSAPPRLPPSPSEIEIKYPGIVGRPRAEGERDVGLHEGGIAGYRRIRKAGFRMDALRVADPSSLRAWGFQREYKVDIETWTGGALASGVEPRTWGAVDVRVGRRGGGEVIARAEL
ncbi:hypothetical protein DFH06DRAFT_601068 [Mycena polygramma]|nr:hypothetical protein DFH06DRAFT_601068 [Mycena polygramma]